MNSSKYRHVIHNTIGLVFLQVSCGYASDALTQFLSTGLTNAQLARIRKTIDTGTAQVLMLLAFQLDIPFEMVRYFFCLSHCAIVLWREPRPRS